MVIEKKQNQLTIYFLMAILLLVSFVISAVTGEFKFSLWQTLSEMFAGKTSDAVIILREIRLPRALLAVLVGATLGMAGAAMQGFLRNPLAEPGILGVTGGGVFGAVLMICTGVYALFPLALPAGGMAGAFLSVLILYFFAGRTTGVQTLILAGVAFNVLAFAGTSLVLNLSPNPFSALEIVFWQMGSLSDRSFDHVFLSAPFIFLGWILLLWDGRALNALTLGEETAMTLGIPMHRVRLRVILGTALSVGAAVAVSGSIGFVGLVIPHLLRPLVHYEPGKLLGLSALGGAILLLWADICVRLIPIGTELKLGVLTALIGAPFFILLVFHLRRKIA